MMNAKEVAEKLQNKKEREMRKRIFAARPVMEGLSSIMEEASKESYFCMQITKEEYLDAVKARQQELADKGIEISNYHIILGMIEYSKSLGFNAKYNPYDNTITLYV